ncbi:hypothetical protein [Haliangium ochraceum]|uniref:Uncharacterized protein n=1 Tax=Haliangium ochraceum (strain DSM 14365 / JCM 11303 / SMP-2) TaxID=502025 RepID=D0LH92_HALO1|nr:hypothetical protein [Haliangium ochraceum]ACY18237.1 hypothetical protein Hoch_5760 [Haliangium ochraceum DSM 14365]
MDGIQFLRDEFERARKQRVGVADQPGAVTRTEAIAIVRRAVSAGVSVDDIRQAFRDAGDNGFGVDMGRYLNEFDIIRLIGSEPKQAVRLPHRPKLDLRKIEFSSSYGGLRIDPLVGPSDADVVKFKATCGNPYAYSSGPGEQPSIFGRDGLFDQLLLHVYGFEFSDPLDDQSRAMAYSLARDSRIGSARQHFIEATPGAIEVALPKAPKTEI